MCPADQPHCKYSLPQPVTALVEKFSHHDLLAVQQESLSTSILKVPGRKAQAQTLLTSQFLGTVLKLLNVEHMLSAYRHGMVGGNVI